MARVKQLELPKVTIGTEEGPIVYSDVTDVAFNDGYIEFDGTSMGQRRHVVSNAPYVYEEKA